MAIVELIRERDLSEMGRNSKRNREKMLRDALEAQRVENLRHPKERLLPVEFIEELRRNGLSVGDFPSFMSTHVYPSGYLVILPEASGGNSLFDEGAYYLDDESDEKTYMPSLTLWGETGNWNISVWAWTPGPGPGDFTKKLTSLDDVLENILSYFFNPNDEHFKEADLARHEMRRRSRL